MDRITESLLADFSKEHGLDALAEEKRFEHFAAYITARRHYSESFDTSEIVTGSGGDGGIDAIAAIINGSLVTDVEVFSDQYQNAGSLDVTFIFVQAERSSSFDGSKIGQFLFGVQDFFRDTPQLQRTSAIKEAAELMTEIYSRSSKFKRGNPTCQLYYVTTGRWQNDAYLESRRTSAISDLKETGLFRTVEFSCIGADIVQKLYNQTKNALSREFTFAEKAVIPEISGVSEAYLGYVPAHTFLSLVCDDKNDVIKSIFYDNVRDWQNYNEVNGEIYDTLNSQIKARFVLMNNGITIIARTVRPTGNRFYIEDYQVVNGCQTSHVLADARDQIDDTVMVPLRLIGTQDEDVISSIVHATNRQTEVKQEQFFAVTDFAKKIELYFSSFGNGKKLFYERRSHQYDSVSLEKTRIITTSNLVKAFAAMYLQEPHATTRNYSRLTEQIGRSIFGDGHKVDPYYVAAFASYRLEWLFRNKWLDRDLKPARYHLLLATRLLANSNPLPKMNSREMERHSKEILQELWDPFTSEGLFDRAADVINYVAAGNYKSDNIRVLAFTENVIARCQEIS